MTKLLAGLKILVVDDAADNRLLLSRLLSLSGADVATVSNAPEGISGALGGEFDVILMDIQMPGMDGYEAIQRLRSLQYKGPVVALTAHAMSVEKKRCLDSGFDFYLTKPISRTDLIDTLLRLTQEKRIAQ